MNRLFLLLLAIVAAGLALLLINGSAGKTFGLENDDFARLVGLSAIGVFLGAGLLSRRAAMTGVARDVAIWLAVAVALVGSYTYRFEIQDAASRATGGVIAPSPLALAAAEGRETVLVERTAGGHFETEAAIDGASISMLVDTGASATVLTSDDARRVGFDPGELSYSVPVTTANGRTEAARVQADQIAIGGIVRRDVAMLVAKPGVLDQSLLGMNVIDTLSGFDMRGGRLILRD
jgi:aspartyl protease family protein